MLPDNSKRQNVTDDGVSFQVDRISNLPDFVLSHILSFLPTTKESFRASILSKRWRNVWTHVDKLVFDNPHCLVRDMKHYKRFLSNVVKAHKGNIKEFSLSGEHHNLGYEELNVVKLVKAVISRGVERLHVDFHFPERSPPCPLSVFSCKTLVDLKMWSLCHISLDVPSTPIFPCLKKLDVRECDSEFFENVVPRCLALEDLTVSLTKGLLDDFGSRIDVVSASVKRLALDSSSLGPAYSFDPEGGNFIHLRVPSLQYLKFHCVLPLEFTVKGKLSSLNEADIHFRSNYKDTYYIEEVCESFEKIIQTISNVKSLRVQLTEKKFFKSVGHGLFANLTKLEIVSAYFEWKLLLSFMESSINLEAITLTRLYNGINQNSTLKKHKLAWKEPRNVPTCLSSSLKIISLDGYSEDELPMVKYVLSNAQVLERVDIKCAIYYKDKNKLKPIELQKPDMLQNLQKLHKASGRCEIVFV